MSMTGSSSSPGADAALVSAPVPGRLIALALLRSVGVVAATLLAYALLPIRQEAAAVIAALALLGIVLLGVVFARQLARISRHARPVSAAIESLTLVFGMFLSLFAFVYVALSQNDPGAFTQPIGKMAGVYFSVTILATVGFGDISAVTDLARAAVTVQMVLDLVLIGAAVKLLGISAKRGVEAKLARAGLTEADVRALAEQAGPAAVEPTNEPRDPTGAG
jgi:xanthosine utilization system XapX-like protein